MKVCVCVDTNLSLTNISQIEEERYCYPLEVGPTHPHYSTTVRKEGRSDSTQVHTGIVGRKENRFCSLPPSLVFLLLQLLTISPPGSPTSPLFVCDTFWKLTGWIQPTKTLFSISLHPSKVFLCWYPLGFSHTICTLAVSEDLWPLQFSSFSVWTHWQRHCIDSSNRQPAKSMCKEIPCLGNSLHDCQTKLYIVEPVLTKVAQLDLP